MAALRAPLPDPAEPESSRRTAPSGAAVRSSFSIKRTVLDSAAGGDSRAATAVLRLSYLAGSVNCPGLGRTSVAEAYVLRLCGAACCSAQPRPASTLPTPAAGAEDDKLRLPPHESRVLGREPRQLPACFARPALRWHVIAGCHRVTLFLLSTRLLQKQSTTQ